MKTANLHSQRLIELVHKNQIQDFIQHFDKNSICVCRDDDLVQYLIDHDRDEILLMFLGKFHDIALTNVDKKHQTWLHRAVLQSSTKVVRMLLIQSCSLELIDIRNSWGETALHLATNCGNRLLVEILLCHGAKKELLDNWGRTPGDVAIQQGYTSLVTSFNLIVSEKKCDTEINLTNKENQQLVAKEFMTALSSLKLKRWEAPQLEELENSSDSIRTNLKVKVKTIFGEFEEQIDVTGTSQSSDNINPLKGLTDKVVLRLNNRENERLALSKLIEYPVDTSKVDELLTVRHGEVDVNGIDMFGLTALHKAAAWDDIELVALLLAHKDIDCNVVISTGEFNGYTPLHSAADAYAVRSFQLLLEDKRTNLSQQDSRGRRAIDLARANGLYR